MAPEPGSIRRVAILGATGSIGASTLDVIARHVDRFQVSALTAFRQVDRMLEHCRRFQPAAVVMGDAAAAADLASRIAAEGLTTRVENGPDAIRQVASARDSDTVMAAIVGAAGLLPVLDAVRAGKRVLLANKEPLVMCGTTLMREAKAHGAEIIPIDSEHNAIFQCMPAGYRTGERPVGIRRVILTCSGGPFRTAPESRLARVTPEEACNHPRWSMGKKISVDSATLMNKGLELIEACRLFQVGPDQVEVVIHPQSIVHSMVEYTDGSVLAQMGNPDMRTPIAHALAWPERIESGVSSLDLIDLGRLDFESPDSRRFPCLELAERAVNVGGTMPAILNAANEVAVSAFLDRRVPFTAIPRIIEQTMMAHTARPESDVEVVIEADQQARQTAGRVIEQEFRKQRTGAV